MNNLILSVDSYKHSQYLQYPPNTTSVFSYIEARGGRFDETVFFGLQGFIKKYLTNPITIEDIDQSQSIIDTHMGEGLFNRSGWEYILNEHNGYLPLKIKAVPEGTVIDTKNVLVTVENTDSNCFWLTSFVESAILRAVWYPLTVATRSREIKKVIRDFLVTTADDSALDGIGFLLHDFGARGVSSSESAGIGGAAHLVNFMGTDTIEGMLWAMEYYNTDVPAFSVPASEHSTITSWGKENESQAYKNMFKQFGGKYPIVSVVSDSYDIYNAVENIWGDELKDMVISSGSTLVIRPDSGEPADVVGNIAALLDEKYGSVVNSKGYKVLNNVKILQGDGLSELIDFYKILDKLTRLGFSTDNVVFGMGGGLLQQVNRDTCKMAMKASYAVVDGEGRDVYKDPITDAGKRSKRGRLALIKDDEGYKTVPEDVAGDFNELQTVYLNGKLLNETTFDEVRSRAAL